MLACIREFEIGPCGAQPWQGQISELPADNGRLGDAALPICLARTVASERDQLRTDSDDRFDENQPIKSQSGLAEQTSRRKRPK